MGCSENDWNVLMRGVVDCLPAGLLKKRLEENNPLTIKLGCDPTGSDLHLGHAVALNKLEQFRIMGHNVVLVIGDFTATIGDASGRDKSRPVLGQAEVQKNSETYIEQASKFLDVSARNVKVLYNSKWLGLLTFGEILKYASYCTVSQLLAAEHFSKRYKEGNPISLREFFYPIAQALDSLSIKADVELGGTDQLFNMMMGRQLQKAVGFTEQVAITLPILVGLDGRKMSKSFDNYIGFNDSAEEIYGKIMSITDEMMSSYFRLLTVSNCDESADPMGEKKRLARHIVARFHGDKSALEAEKNFNSVVVRKEEPTKDRMKPVVISGIPRGWNGLPLCFVMRRCGVESNAEAKRLIVQGGVSVSKIIVKDRDFSIPITTFPCILRIGKRNFYRVSVELDIKTE
ncbi:MAG: tyrosine--tRNA ligase [bacterium]|nr:tyrosine--tRNA ligase [bacterium]